MYENSCDVKSQRKTSRWMHILYLHFDIWVRVAISVHGSEVNAAHDAHNEAVQLGAVHEGDQNTTTFFHISAIFRRLRE